MSLHSAVTEVVGRMKNDLINCAPDSPAERVLQRFIGELKLVLDAAASEGEGPLLDRAVSLLVNRYLHPGENKP